MSDFDPNKKVYKAQGGDFSIIDLLRSFAEVNGHFKTLFKQLFGGGNAELQLTEADDPLDAGLEIMASPPG